MHNDPEWFEPKGWPLFWRRAFLLTAPISFPLYLAAWVVGMVVFIIAVIFVGAPLWFFERAHDTLWVRHPQELKK